MLPVGADYCPSRKCVMFNTILNYKHLNEKNPGRKITNNAVLPSKV